ncbi:MAG: TIM barrel protein [Bacteroidia bacterium]|nr:TIM barrel protein [Bacteroidia bacterium]
MNRRHFLQTSAALGAASLLGSCGTDTPMNTGFGIQLFSLPRLLEQDFRQAIALLASMGYRSVELYGPYPFSAPGAIDRWKAVTPALGFSGSGYFGLQREEVAGILREHGLTAPSIHTDLDTLETRMGPLAEAAHALGHQYVGLPAIPDERRTTLDGYKRTADAFNAIGEAAKREGIRFAYHNHGYGLQELDGELPLDLLIRRTDPGLVFLEMDIFWMTAGGGDPVAYLRSYPGRYRLMHLKDMKERKRFSGDGGNAMQWIELFPYMTTAGSGVLDLAAIVAAAREAGVEHLIVEQDMVAQPEIALQQSLDFLKGV